MERGADRHAFQFAALREHIKANDGARHGPERIGLGESADRLKNIALLRHGGDGVAKALAQRQVCFSVIRRLKHRDLCLRRRPPLPLR